MSYKSPIEVLTEESELRMEEGIVKAVQRYGIIVNKTELQKALMYDRKQYTQGFEDGRKYEQEERGCGEWEESLSTGLLWKCSECKSRYETKYRYCPNCGAKMEEVKR